MLEDALSNDPLYLDLIIILTIGAITALMLAVIGDLLTSWLSVRTRLTNFAVLRALGASPGQIASVLTWEQAIVYVAEVSCLYLCAMAYPTVSSNDHCRRETYLRG